MVDSTQRARGRKDQVTKGTDGSKDGGNKDSKLFKAHLVMFKSYRLNQAVKKVCQDKKLINLIHIQFDLTTQRLKGWNLLC